MVRGGIPGAFDREDSGRQGWECEHVTVEGVDVLFWEFVIVEGEHGFSVEGGVWVHVWEEERQHSADLPDKQAHHQDRKVVH